MTERKFKRELNSLEGVFGFISDVINENKINEGIAFSINLAVEELFTNMVKYNPGKAGDIVIRLGREDNQLRVDLIDIESKPFDITKTPEVDTGKPLDDRNPGGLGIHLVKKMMDNILYDYSNGTSTITLIKNLET